MANICKNSHDQVFRQNSNSYNCDSCHEMHSSKDDGWGMLIPVADYHGNCRVCYNEGKQLKSDLRSTSADLVLICNILKKKKKGDPKQLLDQLYLKVSNLVYNRLLASPDIFNGNQTFNTKYNQLKDALININYARGALNDKVLAVDYLIRAWNNVSVSTSDIRD